MGKLFGTDGVRGVANTELTPELAFRLGVAGARVLTAHSHEKPTIIVGKDTRISGQMLEAALVAGIASAGADVLLAGVVPTPAIAYLVRTCGCAAGVVISASHNSFEYNGIKFFSESGHKLPDAIEDEIEAMMENDRSGDERPTGGEIGQVSVYASAAHDYLEHLKRCLSVDLTGLRIAVDCAHGASYAIAPQLFADLGADVVAIGVEPNGLNINDGCGSTHLDVLQKTVKSHRCHLGLAFDGDADRLLAVDADGDIVDGDVIMAIIAADMKAHGQLEHDTLVTTQMSNIGLDKMADREGLKLVKTQVGDRYVLEAMLEGGFSLGGEQSGHIILLEHTTTGDGMLSALKLLNALIGRRQKLHEARTIVKIFPQVLKNAVVRADVKGRVMEDPELQEAIRRVDQTLEGRGRLLVRVSGTEPLVRVMLEGEDIVEIRKIADSLTALILQNYGV